MATFLVKTEPTEYSLEDLYNDDHTTWDGVRNPVAVKAIRMMQPGDRVLIYHSGVHPAIVGEAQVISDPLPDEDDPKSWVIDLKYLRSYEEPITLKEIKDSGLFDDWALVRQGRLSTMAVPQEFLLWLRHHHVM